MKVGGVSVGLEPSIGDQKLFAYAYVGVSSASVLHPVRHAITLMEELVFVPFLALLDQIISFK